MNISYVFDFRQLHGPEAMLTILLCSLDLILDIYEQAYQLFTIAKTWKQPKCPLLEE